MEDERKPDDVATDETDDTTPPALSAQETPQDPTPEQQSSEPESVSAEQIRAITARLDELERLVGELKAHDAIFDEPTHEDDTDTPMSVDEAVAALFED